MGSKQRATNDIKNYSLYADYITGVEVDSLDIMLNVIENIYAVFLLKFNPNNEVKDYLNNLISDKLVYYIQFKFDKAVIANDMTSDKDLKDNKSMKNQQKIDEMYEELSDRLFDSISDDIRFLLTHKEISNEIKGLVTSLFKLIDFPKDLVEQKIKDEKSIVDIEELKDEALETTKQLYSYYDSLSRLD